ncbi:MAG TPA: M1 family aminopeptidase [Mycobacteriales bacterium]|jgi:hypothetical protein|nr:M1 family aminopeptidase [Mycobacteriales bacterium]
MRSLAAAAVALALLAGCTPRDRAAAPTTSPSPSVATTTAAPSTTVPPSPSGSPAVTASASAPAGAPCPAAYAAPDPARPVVDLTFVVADDKASVRGREKVTFTPDRPTDRLVFRLWANEPAARRGGGSSAVTSVSVGGRAAAFSASADRTTVTVPGTHPAGRPVVADLAFTVTLPSGVNERFGHRGGTAWFGSGFPLLAWERGRGWATEPATAAFAEAATSESFRLTLHVDTAPGDVVLGTGAPTGQAGRVRHRSADAVRDVLVAVGPFRTATASAGGVPVTVGVAPGLPDSAPALARQHVAAIRTHAARFGPFPYASLDVAVVPDVHGGIEFPAGIILGHAQDQDATLVHEVAHEWFYGLVGDDQGRDPWLDEAFATYAEALANGTAGRYLSTPVPASGRNRVGAPMTYWEPRTAVYYRSVYVQGAAALLRARRAAGTAAFDGALRCYVAANAHRIATPADLAAALNGLPAAVAVLRRYGALPRG